MAYQSNIPTGTVPFDQDYLNVQGNFQQLNVSYGVDHVPYSDTSGIPPSGISGMHTAIHLVPQAAPAALAGYGQLFDTTVNDGFSNDQSLYFLTGGNLLLQLTRNFLPSANTNGYTFIPGGLVLQWGIVNGTHGGDNHFNLGDTGTVTFATANKAFPSACLAVWTQPNYTTGNAPSGAATVSVASNFSKTSFVWTFSSNSSAYTSFLWFALGN